MKWNIATAGMILALFGSAVVAAPLPGRYVGLLKTSKKVDGLIVSVSTRAEAKVSEHGELTVVVAVPEGPSPKTQDGATQYVQASNVLRTTIASDDTCIVPGSRIPYLPIDVPGSFPVIIPADYHPFAGYYTHLAKVQVQGSRFSLTYNDLAREFTVMQTPSSVTEFSYTFRLVGK